MKTRMRIILQRNRAALTAGNHAEGFATSVLFIIGVVKFLVRFALAA